MTHENNKRLADAIGTVGSAFDETKHISVAPTDARTIPTIIVVCGLPRSGKDTLIRACIDYASSGNTDTRIQQTHAFTRIHMRALSSVKDIKEFVNHEVEPYLEDDKLLFAAEEPTQVYRDLISSVKAILDDKLNYTFHFARQTLVGMGARDVLFYQVRETKNLNALSYIENANFLSIHVVREDRPETPLALSDRDGLNAYGGFKFDYLINSRLEDMSAHAALIFNRVSRIVDGTDKASNRVARKRVRAVKQETAKDEKELVPISE